MGDIMKKYNDLKNQKIGNLTVLELSQDKFDSNKTTKLWKCKCECGKIVYYPSRHLQEFKKKNYNVSCGCKQYKNLINKKIGDLLVIEKIKLNDKIYWNCQCECGEIVLKTTRQLSFNRNICHLKLQEISNKKKRIQHVFDSMKSRCYCKDNKSYHNYGGRGIKICDEWLNDSQKFYNWAITSGYEYGLEIDRIDNDGNYEPNNCRWVDKTVQANNKRNNLIIEYNGKTANLKQWCNELNLPYRKTHKRIYNLKWSIEKAFTYDNEKRG